MTQKEKNAKLMSKNSKLKSNRQGQKATTSTVKPVSVVQPVTAVKPVTKISPTAPSIYWQCWIFALSCLIIAGGLYIYIHHKQISDYESEIPQIQKDLAYTQNIVNEMHAPHPASPTGNDTLVADGHQSNMNQLGKDTDIPSFHPKDSGKFLGFEQLIGFKDEKTAVDGFIDYIQHPDSYQGIGDVDAPLGILLYGCPGTGKTTLARALAKEVKLPFFEVPSSIFARKYKGEAVDMVTDLFATAREVAEKTGGAIIFLDECETIFTNIATLEAGSEVANVVNAFKTEMTSTDNNQAKPIFVIGATNHVNDIEEAIRSRFTYNIEVKPGNLTERQAYLEFMINRRNNPYDEAAKKYLFDVINVAIDRFQGHQTALKSNRSLENLLKTAVNIFAKNRQTTDGLRAEISQADLKAAYAMVIDPDTKVLDEIAAKL